MGWNAAESMFWDDFVKGIVMLLMGVKVKDGN